jgi:hypothetical protein
MGDVPVAIRTYAGGGELSLREKSNLLGLLKQVGFPETHKGLVHPPYIDELVELVTRFIVRPTELADVLRYAEYLAVTEANRIEGTVALAFGAHVHPIAAKLLADICGFLVTAPGLRPEFRSAARGRLVIDLTGGDPSGAANGAVSPASKGLADQPVQNPVPERPSSQLSLPEGRPENPDRK